jgi:hypothetical protein
MIARHGRQSNSRRHSRGHGMDRSSFTSLRGMSLVETYARHDRPRSPLYNSPHAIRMGMSRAALPRKLMP